MPDDRLALDAALAHLDTVFTDPPPLSGPVRGCGMCWSDEDLAALGGPPADVSENGDLDGVVYGLESTSGSIAPWLDRLDDLPEVDAGLFVFALDVAWWSLWQTFLESRSALTSQEQFAAWLTGPTFAARLKRHLAAYPDCRNALDTAAAVADLRSPEAAVEDGRWGAALEGCGHG